LVSAAELRNQFTALDPDFSPTVENMNVISNTQHPIPNTQ
jgi:hypothetical protein